MYRSASSLWYKVSGQSKRWPVSLRGDESLWGTYDGWAAGFEGPGRVLWLNQHGPWTVWCLRIFSCLHLPVWGGGGGGGVGGWGGGHCLFEGRCPLPNYRPCFLVLSTLKSLLTAPYFLGSETPHPKLNILNTKLSKLFYTVFNMMNVMYFTKYSEYKYILYATVPINFFCGWIHLFFLPKRSWPPLNFAFTTSLCAAIRQWVPIQTQVPPLDSTTGPYLAHLPVWPLPVSVHHTQFSD